MKDEEIIHLQAMQLISVRHELAESKRREEELQASQNVLSTWIIELTARVKTLEDAIRSTRAHHSRLKVSEILEECMAYKEKSPEAIRLEIAVAPDRYLFTVEQEDGEMISGSDDMDFSVFTDMVSAHDCLDTAESYGEEGLRIVKWKALGK